MGARRASVDRRGGGRRPRVAAGGPAGHLGRVDRARRRCSPAPGPRPDRISASPTDTADPPRHGHRAPRIPQPRSGSRPTAASPRWSTRSSSPSSPWLWSSRRSSACCWCRGGCGSAWTAAAPAAAPRRSRSTSTCSRPRDALAAEIVRGRATSSVLLLERGRRATPSWPPGTGSRSRPAEAGVRTAAVGDLLGVHPAAARPGRRRRTARSPGSRALPGGPLLRARRSPRPHRARGARGAGRRSTPASAPVAGWPPVRRPGAPGGAAAARAGRAAALRGARRGRSPSCDFAPDPPRLALLVPGRRRRRSGCSLDSSTTPGRRGRTPGARPVVPRGSDAAALAYVRLLEDHLTARTPRRGPARPAGGAVRRPARRRQARRDPRAGLSRAEIDDYLTEDRGAVTNQIEAAPTAEPRRPAAWPGRCSTRSSGPSSASARR